MKGSQTRGARLLALGALLCAAQGGTAQEVRGRFASSSGLEARVWLDRGADPTLRRGENARLYYSASQDAYISIFQIDTDGGVRLLFPRSPDEPHLARGGYDYRLLFTRSPFWRVDEDPGLGYFFLVASPRPFDFSAFGYSHFDRGWNLSRVGRQVYRDPHVAMDDFVAALIPDWQAVPYALDFVSYQVDARFEYPRFLCYDCHGFRPYSAWNPYLYACTNFRLVVYTDPYYYPATRYRGNRVVFVRPPSPFEPQFSFKERASNETSRPLVLSSERRLYEPPARVGAPATTRSQPYSPFRESERRPATSRGVVEPRPGSSIPNVERRPSSPPPAAGDGRPAVAVPGGTGRPTTGTAQDRSRPVLQPRPSSPARTAEPPPSTSRPSPERESSARGAQPGTTRARPGTQAPPRPATTSGTPPPVPAPRRPPPG
jgi:hypothetical protein